MVADRTELLVGWFPVYDIQILGNKWLLIEQNCLLVGFLFMAFRF